MKLNFKVLKRRVKKTIQRQEKSLSHARGTKLDVCQVFFFIESDYSPLYQRRFTHKSRPPLFCVPRLDDLCDISTVDAILISNYHSFCALPWILETGKCEDWSGAIYCTKPTLEFARIYLTELRKYCDMAENEHKVKTFDTSGSYSQTSLNALPCVSKEQIEACLDRVQERIFLKRFAVS